MIRPVVTPAPVALGTDVEVFGPFDYGSLPADKAARARDAVAYIGPRLRSATATMLEVGSKLLEVKADLEHGQFIAWVEAEFPFSIRSAQRYMKASEALAVESDTVSYLPVSTVHEIAAADEHTRDLLFIEMNRTSTGGRPLREEEVKSLLAEGREREQKAREERRKSPEQLAKDKERAARHKRELAKEQRERERRQAERQAELLSQEKAVLAAMNLIRDRFGGDLPELVAAFEGTGHQFSEFRTRLRAPFGQRMLNATMLSRTRPWFEEPESEWPRY